MSRPALYLCPIRPCASLVNFAVGLLPMMTERYGTVGVFRPLVTTAADPVLSELLSYAKPNGSAEHWGVTVEQALADPEGCLRTIVERFHQVAVHYDAMLVVGSAYDSPLVPVEFTLNTQIATNVAAPLVLVLPNEGGAGGIAARLGVAVQEARRNHARVQAVLTPAGEGLSSDDLVGLTVPVFPVPDPDQAEAGAVPCQLLVGECDVTSLSNHPGVVAGRSLSDLLGMLRADSVVYFDHACAEIALGLMIGAASGSFPAPVAAVATGGAPDEALVNLWRQLLPETPLACTPAGAREFLAQGSGAGQLSGVAADRARRVFAAAVDPVSLVGSSAPVGSADVVTPLMFERSLMERAKKAGQHIVLPEGEEPRILKAAHRLLADGICGITLLGDEAVINSKAADLGLDLSAARVINPRTSELREKFAEIFAELRAKKGITIEQARQQILDVSHFGTMMVREGMAGGMVSGAINTTANTIRPALQIIKTKPGTSVVSSAFLMCLTDRVLVMGDCAVNPNPKPEQVADIAISSAETARQFGVEPRVAMISYSTGTSGSGPDVDATVEATRIAKERAPELLLDGPLQYDAAVDETVAHTKLPDSKVAGRATVFIFPDLKTGNTTYKAIQRSANALAIGPVLQGLNKPVNDLSRGALVSDIINTVAITAIQAGMN